MKPKRPKPTATPALTAAATASRKSNSDLSPAGKNREIAFHIKLQPGQTHAGYTAELWTGGVFGNATTAQLYSENLGGHGDLTTILTHMQQRAAAVTARDLGGMEAMLAAQVVSLNAIYTHLALIAQSNFTRSLDTSERCLRLAFKAQSQSRATAEAIAFIQNPSGAVFARQANVAHGPQQVNNGTTSQALAHAEHTETRPNELKRIEAAHDPMDTSASRTAGAVDLPMAPVGTRHRATKRRR